MQAIQGFFVAREMARAVRAPVSSENATNYRTMAFTAMDAPAPGPQAQEAFAALREIWLGCRQFFLMREATPGVNLPDQIPARYSELATAGVTGGEAALAAQERADPDFQGSYAATTTC